MIKFNARHTKSREIIEKLFALQSRMITFYFSIPYFLTFEWSPKSDLKLIIG